MAKMFVIANDKYLCRLEMFEHWGGCLDKTRQEERRRFNEFNEKEKTATAWEDVGKGHPCAGYPARGGKNKKRKEEKRMKND